MSQPVIDNQETTLADQAAPSGRGLALALLLLTPAMFSTNMLVARAASNFMPPAGMALGRWLGAMLLLLPFCAGPLWRQRRAVLCEWRTMVVLAMLGMVICGAVVYYGAATTTATNIGLIYASSPVLIIVFARLFYGEAMTRRQLAGVSLSLLGVLVIIAKGDWHSLTGLRFTIGDLCILLAAIAWALYAVLIQHRKSALEPTTRLAAIIATGAMLLLPIALWEHLTVRAMPFDWRSLGIVVLLAAVPGFGAYQSYGYVQRVLGVGPTGLIMYLAPLYTGLLAYLLLGEALHLYHLAGAVLVLPGIYLATRRVIPK
jgi:drug/metabolite transporter (DMT)-like permease